MKIALLVPDPRDALYAPYATPYFEPYRAQFAGEGVDAIAVPWTGSPPAGIDGAVPMLAWGYHMDPPAWLTAIARWSAVPLVNSPEVLRWNTRKTYLADLERAGVPIVPTVFAARADAEALAAAARRFGTEDIVVKPQVSAGGHRTVRLRPGEPPAEVVEDAMIQPFQAAVGGDGELSVFFFAGKFSHAVRKVAAAGEFRVQPSYGGRLSRFDPDAGVLATARRALAAAPHLPVYARVDLVRGADGRPLLMELEAIEPDIYLDLAPEGGRAWAKAIRLALE
jgi:glutathione synthase/RimK-type ligase-like ATP-grasp enzyme